MNDEGSESWRGRENKRKALCEERSKCVGRYKREEGREDEEDTVESISTYC